MEKKPGFLETAAGERSSTKLFNMLYGLALMSTWVALCWARQEIIPLDPTVIVPLGIGQGANVVNKWIEANGNEDKARFIKAIMSKVQQK